MGNDVSAFNSPINLCFMTVIHGASSVAMLTILQIGTAFFCKIPSRASWMSQSQVVFFKVTKSLSSFTTSKSFNIYLTNTVSCSLSLIPVDSSRARLIARQLLRFVYKLFKISAVKRKTHFSIVCLQAGISLISFCSFLFSGFKSKITYATFFLINSFV